MPIIAVRHPSGGVPIKYYRAHVSYAWLKRHDNGASVSCGLTVGTDLTEYEMQVLVNRKLAVEITQDEWNHSGCQSECIRRGGKECRW